MNSSRRLLGIGFVLAVVLGARAQAGPEPIALRVGPNDVDLDGDGTADVVVKARWENGNSHSFWNYVFYRRGTEEGWDVVPVDFEDKKLPRIGLNSHEGADCAVSDVRLVRTGDQAVELVVAERDMGSSYADKRSVTFTWFGLRRADVPGEVRLRFAKLRERASKTTYCDVGEAFQQELGIR